MLWRKERPEGVQAPLSGNSTATLNSVLSSPANHLEAMEERLQRLNDETSWHESHTQMVIDYNKTSMAFWLLCAASSCFAILNGYHGWTSSGASNGSIAAAVIALLYFTIELTVPVSAHLASWGAKGQSRFILRGIGTIAFFLGVIFSLLILQGKFSSGADTQSALAEASSVVFQADKDGLETNRAKIRDLRASVGSRDEDSYNTEVLGLLGKSSGKVTVGKATDDCMGQRKTSVERETCATIDTLRRKAKDAKALALAEEKVNTFSLNLMDTDRTKNKGGDAQDRMFEKMFGISLENIKLFKASIIAVMAALLTHLLWFAHGMSVNYSIASRRDTVFERNALERALKREDTRKVTSAQETNAKFLLAQGTSSRVAAAVASSPLAEQPAAVQMQQYYTDCTVMGPDFSMQVGQFHDHYVIWAKSHGIQRPVPVGRFVDLAKQLGLGVSEDGRITGAAISR